MRKVYLDGASTTYCESEVINEMLPCFNNIFGNTSSLHSFGREAMELLDTARDRISKAIKCKNKEIIFTSCGTEANNLAIKGIARANRQKGKHIVTTVIEHKSILDACKDLEQEGFEVSYVKATKKGMVDIGDLIHKIRPDTILVSVMAVNNELGTIQNLEQVISIVKQKDIIFHTDAVAAFSLVDLNIKNLNIDAMTISSHKIYGPKGSACLYVKKGIKIKSEISGGNQENFKRAGTVNLPSIVGFGKAVEIAFKQKDSINNKLRLLGDYFVRQLRASIPNAVINGNVSHKVPNIISVTFDNIDAQAIMMMADMKGIACSLGSACNSGSAEPSYVLKEIGLDENSQKSTIRFSLVKNLTKDDIRYAIENLKEIIENIKEQKNNEQNNKNSENKIENENLPIKTAKKDKKKKDKADLENKIEEKENINEEKMPQDNQDIKQGKPQLNEDKSKSGQDNQGDSKQDNQNDNKENSNDNNTKPEKENNGAYESDIDYDNIDRILKSLKNFGNDA